MKKIAFIIGTLNEEETIGPLIDSIKKDTYKNKEIIVVDGGSRDKTIEIAKSKGATVLIEKGKNKCPANAWNQAINYTDAELICILGADSILLDSGFIEKATKPFDNPKVANVSTRAEVKEDTFIERIVAYDRTSIFTNAVFRRDVALKLGGYPTIGFGEDRIFTMRMAKYMNENNMISVHVPDTVCGGHTVETLGALFKQSKWYGRTSLLYLKEYYKDSNGLFQKIKETIAVYFKMAYFVFFALSFVSFSTPLFYYFFTPFIAIAAVTVLKNIRSPYHVLKIFTNLLAGLGYFIGLSSYVFSINRGRGRG